MNKKAVLTASHLIEYLYCPRFTYYEYVLSISQREEKQFKVMKGRDIHEVRQKVNSGYLRKKLGVVKKEQDIELNCPELSVRGKVDEILYLQDGSLATLDYKYAEYKNKIWKGYKTQQIIYGLMMEHIYQKPVHVGFICFTRSNYQIVEINISEKDKQKAKNQIMNCLDIIQSGVYPGGTRYKKRCVDCTYRNICIQ